MLQSAPCVNRKGDGHGRSPIPSCPVLAISGQPGMLGFKSSAAEKRCIWSVDWPCTRPISEFRPRLESARVPYRPDPSLPALRVVLAVHSPGRGCRNSATHEPGDGDRGVLGRLGGARAVEKLDQVLRRNLQARHLQLGAVARHSYFTASCCASTAGPCRSAFPPHVEPRRQPAGGGALGLGRLKVEARTKNLAFDDLERDAFRFGTLSG